MSKSYGEKKLLMAGNILQGCAMLGLLFIPTNLFIPFEYIAMAALALGNGMLNPSLLSYVSQHSDPRQQGKMIGLFQSFGSLARVVGPLLGGVLYHFDKSIPYITSTLFFVVNVFLIINLQKVLSAYKKEKEIPLVNI